MTASPNVSGEPEWTVDDVRHLPEDLHYELIGGRLMLSPPVLPFHQVLSLQTATALHLACPEEGVISTGQSVLIDSRNEARPDVVLIRGEGADRYAGIPAYWVVDPLGERVAFTGFELGPGGAYHARVRTDGLVAIDRPWEITLDLPAWTRRRDRLREVARPDRWATHPVGLTHGVACARWGPSRRQDRPSRDRGASHE
jgi:Uma2 family endonuclease